MVAAANPHWREHASTSAVARAFLRARKRPTRWYLVVVPTIMRTNGRVCRLHRATEFPQAFLLQGCWKLKTHRRSPPCPRRHPPREDSLQGSTSSVVATTRTMRTKVHAPKYLPTTSIYWPSVEPPLALLSHSEVFVVPESHHLLFQNSLLGLFMHGRSVRCNCTSGASATLPRLIVKDTFWCILTLCHNARAE